MGYLAAERIRKERTEKAIKAWERAGKPSSEQALEAYKAARAAIEGDWMRVMCSDWKDSSEADTKARKYYYYTKNVWIGALNGEGKCIMHLT